MRRSGRGPGKADGWALTDGLGRLATSEVEHGELGRGLLRIVRADETGAESVAALVQTVALVVAQQALSGVRAVIL